LRERVVAEGDRVRGQRDRWFFPLTLLACGELSLSGSTGFGELSRAELAEVREGRGKRDRIA
jgi:hypothetical protein